MKKCSVTLPALLALAALFVLERTAFLPVLLAASAVHEAGHLLAVRLCGLHLLELRLTLGGAELVHTPGSYRDDLRIALAGPAASLLLAAGMAAVRMAWRVPGADMLAGVSAALGAFNLLPALPLDGGRALFAALAVKTGRDAAIQVLRACGIAVAAAVGAAGIWSYAAAGSGAGLVCAGALVIFFVVRGAEMV